MNAGSDVSLPNALSEPVSSLEECVLLIYGERKIGKTTLASMFKDAMFLMFEPGGKGFRAYQRPVPTWATFTKYCALLTKESRFSTIVIDTVDAAYDRCFEHVCRTAGVAHPSEGAYGAVWNGIEAEFVKRMTTLLQTGRGIVFISHAEVREFQEQSGMRYNKLVPSMTKAARTYIAAVADLTGYYGYHGKDRYLTIQGSDALEAGHRLEERFLTASGERVHSVPMGNTKEAAYTNLVAAFNNTQKDTGRPDNFTPAFSETPAPRINKRK